VFSLDDGTTRPLGYFGYPEHAQWSPDGRRIAFSWEEKNCWGVINADGTNPRCATSERAYRAGWSADGQRFLYSSPQRVYSVDAETFGDRRTEVEGAYWADQRSDGALLNTRNDSPQTVWLVDGSGGHPRSIYYDNEGRQALGPKWSSDGKQFLVTLQGKEGIAELVRLSADGKVLQRLGGAGQESFDW
jgi:Tol biopolymer transport system component